MECKDLYLVLLLQENNRLNCGCGWFTPLYDFHMQSKGLLMHSHTHIYIKLYSEDSNKFPCLLLYLNCVSSLEPKYGGKLMMNLKTIRKKIRWKPWNCLGKTHWDYRESHFPVKNQRNSLSFFSRGVHTSDHVQSTVLSRTDALNTSKDTLTVTGTGVSATVGSIGPNRLRSDRSRSKCLLYVCV